MNRPAPLAAVVTFLLGTGRRTSRAMRRCADASMGRCVVCGVAALVLAVAPGRAEGQVKLGLHGATHSFDGHGMGGLGLRLHFEPTSYGLSVLASATGHADNDALGILTVTAAARWVSTAPASVRPYALGGLQLRSYALEVVEVRNDGSARSRDISATEINPVFGAGLEIGWFFLEGTVEFIRADQISSRTSAVGVFKIGVLIG